MKKLLLLMVAVLVTVCMNAQFKRAYLQATGLTCAMCSNAINKALQAKPFIQSVKSDIKNSAFDIVFKENADVDIDEIRKAVEDAGFGIGSLKLRAHFNELKFANDAHVEIGGRHFHFLRVREGGGYGQQTITTVDKHILTADQF